MSKTDIAIRVEGVSKNFLLPHQRTSTLKSSIINPFRGSSREQQRALNDVSFQINKGDFVGIVGRNGSGKSTLLKCMAGVYVPDRGAININGVLVPFIELGVGFNPELSGRDNVYLNGALLGFSRSEMDDMYDDIVEFAVLERFMDQKLKNYSSGMQVRLAFSIAIKADGDILLLDEVLAVGDSNFQKKCYDYFAKLREQKKTIILVTHSMSTVQRFCNKAMLLNDGELLLTGDTATVTKKYEILNRNKNKEDLVEDRVNNPYFEIDSSALNNKGEPTTSFNDDDSHIILQAKIKPKQDIKDAFIGLTLRKPSGQFVYWYTTEEEGANHFTANKLVTLTLKIQNIFGEDTYFVNLSVKSSDRSKEYIIHDNAKTIHIQRKGNNGWMLHPPVDVELEGMR